MGRLERLARLREMELPVSLPSAVTGLDVRRLARLRRMGFGPPWAAPPPRRPRVALSVLAVAAGALAVGAVAIGSIAIGAVAIGRLRLKEARIERLVVDDLTVTRLHPAEAAAEEDEPAPQAQVPDA